MPAEKCTGMSFSPVPGSVVKPWADMLREWLSGASGPGRKGKKYTPRTCLQTHLRRAKNYELLSQESEGFGRSRAGDNVS